MESGDIWNLDLSFAEEKFSKSLVNIYACIPKAPRKSLASMPSPLAIPRTFQLAEQVARATGAEEVVTEARPEGDTLMLSTEEKARWEKKTLDIVGRDCEKRRLWLMLWIDFSGNSATAMETSQAQTHKVALYVVLYEISLDTYLTP